jgi:hypothetical protein
MITTAELIEKVKQYNGCTEASLCSGCMRSTHFLSWDGEVLYDEGCDGE